MLLQARWLVFLVAVLFLVQSERVEAQLAGGVEGGGGGVANIDWDPQSLTVLEEDNSTVTVSQVGMDLEVKCQLTNGLQAGHCVFSLTSIDEFDYILVEAFVATDGNIIWESHQTDFVAATYLLPFLNNPPVVTSNLRSDGFMLCSMTCSRFPDVGFWDGFGEGYWYYLTNPWEMDTDLEVGFYVATGVGVTAGAVAGGLVAVGAAPIVLGGGTVATAGGAGTGVTLTEGGAVIGWVSGGEVVSVSAPITSHAFLGVEAGLVSEGVIIVEGAEAFSAIKVAGEVVVVGSSNFGGTASISEAAIAIVKAFVF